MQCVAVLGLKACFAVVLLGALAFPAPSADATALPGKSAVLVEGEFVSAPRGYRRMCLARPELCPYEATQDDLGSMIVALAAYDGEDALRIAPPALTDETLDRLDRVNRLVNNAITQVNDDGGDHWTLPSRYGDCEDFVLMKRELLARAGLPRTALRVAVVEAPAASAAPYHAVLVVSFDGVDLVLDNLSNRIDRLDESDYAFVLVQSARLPGKWVRAHR